MPILYAYTMYLCVHYYTLNTTATCTEHLAVSTHPYTCAIRKCRLHLMNVHAPRVAFHDTRMMIIYDAKHHAQYSTSYRYVCILYTAYSSSESNM